MKYVHEFRDARAVEALISAIHATTTRPWTIMEVCGGQTHAIVRFGIDQLLPPHIELLHGPGCPVCVTPMEMLDRAHHIARLPGVIFCSFGDMLRVPGSSGDLLSVKAGGGDVRIVYSPLDAVEIAAANPARKVVFFAIGFETTAPANGLAVWQARRRGLENFSMLVSHVIVPPVLKAILESPANRVQAFLGPGHVCTVVGFRDYESIASQFRLPIVISGFEPVDLLEGILEAVRLLENGKARVENQYRRVVHRDGNPASRRLIEEVFELCDRQWRGIGIIPESGYKLRHAFCAHDAERRFNVESLNTAESSICISGEILRGLKKPRQCPAFGHLCTPQSPLGATMVSSEGACAAYYTYGRHLELETV
jgi:hydrogenase expression/formation protein HypD